MKLALIKPNIGRLEHSLFADEARMEPLQLGVLAALTATISLLLLPSPEGPVLAAYSLTLLAVALSTRWVHLGNERAQPVAVARVTGEVIAVLLVLATVRNPDHLIRVPFSQFTGDLAAALLLLY